MLTIVSILIFIVAILLVLIVLVQNSKGGGLAANFTGGGGNMGVRKTADFLEKATWTLASILLVLSIAASAAISDKTTKKSEAEQAFEELDPSQININKINEESNPEETDLGF
jgi:preprotein translocase subunit SecG